MLRYRLPIITAFKELYSILLGIALFTINHKIIELFQSVLEVKLWLLSFAT